MEKKLTIMEAYDAMQRFLDIYRKNTQSDQVALLLEKMHLLEKGKTFDPSLWDRWLKCVEEALKEEKKCMHEEPCSRFPTLKNPNFN